MTNSIGLIESKGLVALIEAADVILKNSPVKILGIHKLENGLVSLAVQGNSDYVKAAIDSGVEAGRRVGEIYSSSVIDNPTNELLKLFGELFSEVVSFAETEKEKIVTPKIQNEEKTFFESKIENEVIKPVVRSESKREKSKPLVVTKIDPIQKIKNLKEKKSDHSTQKQKESDTKKNEEDKSEEKPVAENIKSVSTIERLRLEALGLNKKLKEPEPDKTENDESNTEANKINLALDKKDIDFSAIEKMNVHKLRNYARKFPEFPIKGREISRANRDELVKLFKNLGS